VGGSTVRRPHIRCVAKNKRTLLEVHQQMMSQRAPPARCSSGKENHEYRIRHSCTPSTARNDTTTHLSSGVFDTFHVRPPSSDHQATASIATPEWYPVAPQLRRRPLRYGCGDRWPSSIPYPGPPSTPSTLGLALMDAIGVGDDHVSPRSALVSLSDGHLCEGARKQRE
jgi:hypothetical protein